MTLHVLISLIPFLALGGFLVFLLVWLFRRLLLLLLYPISFILLFLVVAGN